ncbi:MAG: hypothetical protein FJ109_09575 [Deltaproteobacteria bacterium]|nr:hypothetical protein [Deltaproteobacteria bacterium]
MCNVGLCTQKPSVKTCMIDDQCTEPGQKCVAGICTLVDAPPECTIDSECSDGKTCKNGKCVSDSKTDVVSQDGSDEDSVGDASPPCETDQECGEGYVCKDGKCAEEPIEPGKCNDADDCPKPEDPCFEPVCKNHDCAEKAIDGCCKTDGDCDDSNPITTDKCVDNQCVNEGPPCTFDDECDDGNPCTIDTCKVGKCQNVKTADPLCCITDADCDDGKADTLDVCIEAQCQFKPKGKCLSDADCVDANPCTKESCKAGTCSYAYTDSPECKCVNDADCIGKGGVCAIFQTGPVSLGTYCTNPVGTKAAGDPCTEDKDCKSNFCLNFSDGKVCFGGCKSNIDCKGGTECGLVTFNVGTGKAELPTCVIPGTECSGDAECKGTDVCVPALNPDNPNQIITVCNGKVGAKTGGQLCTKDSECATNQCINLFEKNIDICWSACQVNEDCPAGLYCYPYMAYFLFDQDTPSEADDLYWAIPGCAPYLGSFKPCQADSDCGGNEFCHAYKNQTNTDIDPHCVTAIGQLGPGSSCNSDSQCKGSWCFNAGFAQFCVGLCKSTGECAPGTSCQQVDLILQDMGDSNPDNDLTVPINVCQP